MLNRARFTPLLRGGGVLGWRGEVGADLLPCPCLQAEGRDMVINSLPHLSHLHNGTSITACLKRQLNMRLREQTDQQGIISLAGSQNSSEFPNAGDT